MKAQVITGFGGTDMFELRDVPKPEAGPGEVLVRIHAASLNPVDAKIRRGGPAFAPALPGILGCDFAGIVEASASPEFPAGAAVYGCAGGVKGMGGAYAEYIIADIQLIAQKPSSLSMRQAAALPLAAITAWEALVDRAQVQNGDHVLIHGGAGGVGHIGIALAKSRGARVTATVSGKEKAVIAEMAGADETLNYKEVSIERYVEDLTGGRGFDKVFDTVGGANLSKSFEAVKIGGVVSTIVARDVPDISPMHAKGLTLHAIFMLLPMLTGEGRARHGEILEQVAGLVDTGQLKPALDENTFTLETIPAAHEYWESGRAMGKIVIDIAS